MVISRFIGNNRKMHKHKMMKKNFTPKNISKNIICKMIVNNCTKIIKLNLSNIYHIKLFR